MRMMMVPEGNSRGEDGPWIRGDRLAMIASATGVVGYGWIRDWVWAMSIASMALASRIAWRKGHGSAATGRARSRTTNLM